MITGYRVWEFVDGELRSPSVGTVWPDGTLSATCELICVASALRENGSARVAEGCSCGIFMWKGLRDSIRGASATESICPWAWVVGMVRAWGRVIHTERGYRVQHAQVAGFLAEPNSELVAEASRCLRVPIYTFKEMAALADDPVLQGSQASR